MQPDIYPVILTPFNNDNTIDLVALKELSEFYITSGSKGLFVNCLSDEMYQLSNKERLLITKTVVEQCRNRQHVISTLSVGIIGVLIGIAMINFKSTLDVWWKLASVFSGGMPGLFLPGVFSKRKNVKGAVIGVICGLLVILSLSLSKILFPEQEVFFPFRAYLTIVFGTTVIFLVGFLIGLFSKK